MACRKAADRALMELTGWLAEQENTRDERYAVLLQQVRDKWCPTATTEHQLQLFDATYCVKFLADGPEVPHQDSVRSGCSGGCGKAHPRISLDWINNDDTYGSSDSGQAVATLSHSDLAPFRTYFEQLCDKGEAVCIPNNASNDAEEGTTNATTATCLYRLTGFLATHLEHLQTALGSHLVKVMSMDALAASRRAHQRQSEQHEETRRQKKQRTRGPAAGHDLLERGLEVCYNNGLADHLDVAEIAWMRCACNAMAKFARIMALEKLQRLKLSHSVLVDGNLVRVRESLWRPYEGGLRFPNMESLPGIVSYRAFFVRVDHSPLKAITSSSSTQPGSASTTNHPTSVFAPESPQVVSFNTFNSDQEAFPGYMVRVYIEGDHSATLPLEQECFGGTPLEVARYNMDLRNVNDVGIHATNDGHAALACTYEVVSAERYNQFYDNPIIGVVGEPCRGPKYRGKFCVKSIQFEFGDLLAVYVRKKLPLAKKKLQETTRKRPATKAEKAYIKALAKAARMALGSAGDYLGMTGWE